MNKQKFLTIATALYCGCLLVANIIAGKTFILADITLPCAVIVFPIVYILNDLFTEVYGFKTARTIILTGFAINVIAVLAYQVTILLPAAPFFTAQEAFATVLGNTPRILIASLIAYLVGSFVNAKVMDILKSKKENLLAFRCISSTLIGETLDAAIFITIGFVGTMSIEALVLMVFSQAMFKTLYEAICYPLTRASIKKAIALPDNEAA